MTKPQNLAASANPPPTGQTPTATSNWKKRLSSYRLLSIGFPIYLIIFESVIRNLFHVDIGSFIGPSLAAGGLGLLIENVKPSKVDATKVGLNLPSGYVVRKKDDETLIIVSWIFVLLCLVAWVYSCVTALNGEAEMLDAVTNAVNESQSSANDENYNYLNWSFGCGIFNYLTGTIISTVKGQD